MAPRATLGAVREGEPEPLGASLTPTGVNIAVWSAHATAIEMCLFEGDGEAEVEIARIVLPGRTGPVFHGHVQGLGEGARYGLRAHGPFAPAQGHRFNPNKLLVDPYALRLDRPFTPHPSMSPHGPDGTLDGAAFDAADSGPFAPKAVVVKVQKTSPPPPAPWSRTLIYELHVRGFTCTHPDIPEAIRGTFAALAHPVVLEHFRRLGVTTIELMPAAAWIDERHLPPLGLTNYWGYNPIALMVPDPRLAPGGWAEVRAATAALAAEGVETILDVVFNHTGEGDALGPTLSLRGLDNAAYYRLDPDNPARDLNDSGTGNTLALNGGPALRLVLDAMRTWRRLGGVGGFRFDLATLLGRDPYDFNPASPLLAAIDQDPDLRTLKLIAEPWDLGPGGYRLGAFPPAWGEWNDQFRDQARDFWRGEAVSLGELARLLSGSEDIFAGRRPSRSVNFVVAHDGFTLADLTAYETKHNLANGEANRDGADHNRSWNHGVEGPTDDPAIRAARLGHQRALLATLMLSRGTPMLAMGAESGRSQGGNNNAYAQDNPIGWMDWSRADGGLLAFTSRLATLRREHPALTADRFLTGAVEGDAPYPDVDWRGPDGEALSAVDWDDLAGETLVMVLTQPTGAGLDRVIIGIHRGGEAVEIVLPEARDRFAWALLADSADPARSDEAPEERLSLAPRSVALLAETPAPGRRPRGADDGVLQRLAEAAGVASDWAGAQGGDHTVSPATQGALLAALGLPAATTQQALESLGVLASDHDRRPLPFAVTGRIGDSPVLRLAYQTADPPPRTWLSLEDESGRVVRLRAATDTGVTGEVRGRDGRISRTLDMTLPALPPGRYRVRRDDRPDLVCRVTIAPRACHAPPALRDARLWGLSAQLYGLERTGDQGVGDFTTLGALGEAAAGRGAALVAVNPLHMLFVGDRERASPYAPSDRRFLDPIYLDLDAVPGADRVSVAPASPADLTAVDYPRVWTLKSQVLEASFALGVEDPDFAAFVAAGGDDLRRFALFQAIAEARPGEPWRTWPDRFRHPEGPAAQAFADAHTGRLRYHQYLQWLCETQLSAAARRAGGLAVGLCRDLAVGAAADGAELWAHAGMVAEGVSIGAPPDPLGPLGQVWGLPPFNPHHLRADGYRTAAMLIGANMRHAGALRIDHVMGLARQFWVPEGAEAADGAYIAFPLTDLLAVVALESKRAGCLVIGEDLGTVPDGLRGALREAGVLSYRVLAFEKDPSGFRPPAAYPRQALACVATHDLPPLAGWWDGADIDERLALALATPDEATEAYAVRREDKRALIEALDREGLIAAPIEPGDPLTLELAAAIHGYVARSEAALALAQVEDLADERIAVNLPGTDRERPNWRRRIATPLERLFETPLAEAIVEALRASRSPPPPR